MDVARLNFSHGSHADHEQVYQHVREAAEATGRAVGILADLQGPKIRLGRFADGPHEWRTGDSVVITSEEILGTAERVSCTYRRLPAEVKPGDRLLIDDGKVAVEVKTVLGGTDIECLVIEGGPVSDNKGVSLPNVAVSVPALSEKDIADLRFALQLGVDLVALSFVRSPSDIELVHGVMDDNVHVQNTLQLAHALQQATKDFEMMLYPTARHGVFSRHYQRLEIEFTGDAAFADGQRRLGQRIARRDPQRRALEVPSDGDAAAIRALLDEVDPDRRTVRRFALHTPTLDDVFLALTGHAAAAADDEEEKAA